MMREGNALYTAFVVFVIELIIAGVIYGVSNS